MRNFSIVDIGLTDYLDAYSVQRDCLLKHQIGLAGDTLLLTEHKPVYTVGRAGSIENLHVDKGELEALGIQCLTVDRGGDITFHGPGQIVAYPIFDLTRHGQDLHAFLRMLEGLAINFLSVYNVEAKRIPGRTGVWVGNAKIASIGIGASRWVSYHGISINVNVDLRYFSLIRPCGIEGVKMTSLKELLGREVDMNSAKEEVARAFSKLFDKSTHCLAGVA